MRHAARVAAAAGRAGPARVAGLKEGAAGFATHAPAVVHPPQQSMRPAYTKEDRSHTEKWLQAPVRTPQEWIAGVAPLEVHGNNTARCYGGSEPSLGHPVEYIVLNDTSAEFPAVCKYCGLRYFQGHSHAH